ncbi:MAG: ribosome recycling factor [Candidatus Uhrbacteria bacterium]|nr:ribosome recycling factor [Patescibacteria group bacterium]MBU1906988.1 ribosome recycling factor [Patescibacteria group bacterium]
MQEVLIEAKPKFAKAIDFLQGELASIRTGRANPALVEDIQVEAYGSMQPVKALGSINVPDSKSLVIEPWDKGVLKAIEKAIRDSDIGISPVVDSNVVRLNMPEMTEENRKDMVKRMKEKLEDTKVKMRGVREDTRGQILQLEKDKEIAEDEKYKLQEDLDKLTKEYTEKVDALGKAKEQEIMTV